MSARPANRAKAARFGSITKNTGEVAGRRDASGLGSIKRIICPMVDTRRENPGWHSIIWFMVWYQKQYHKVPVSIDENASHDLGHCPEPESWHEVINCPITQ
jgi:hypothetical protein